VSDFPFSFKNDILDSFSAWEISCRRRNREKQKIRFFMLAGEKMLELQKVTAP
jgi:hypothetical protein